ncbi:hypothetical protein [uncultured Jannaschia sp.]|uniref:hypothetical protein n=1 Tax=uncultured Jannaschia sp. TaxID=293347 RepID=UPI00261EF662|nr:hypothetical protein [uncultured Jannaschia sp.]
MAERLYRIVLARRTPRQDHALLKILGIEMRAALRMRARYAWERDADLRAEYDIDSFTGEPGDLRIPSPSHDASPEEMEAHYIRWAETR